MSFNPQYAAFVAGRCKEGAAIRTSMTDSQAHMLHMALGVAGELGEIAGAFARSDYLNLREEGGDYAFFLQGIANAIGEDISGSDHDFLGAVDNSMKALTEHTGEIVDIIKKSAIYQKPMDFPALKSAVDRAAFSLSLLLNSHGISIAQCMTDNVEKLSKRYHSGSYSDQQAQERADK